ncbi:MAG: DUF2905 domain-containing protein [Calditrichia bacterium]
MDSFPLQPFGKMLIVIGVIIIVVGLLFMYGNKIPFIGKLPGDIVQKKKNFTFYFPLTTLIIINLLLLLIFRIFKK